MLQDDERWLALADSFYSAALDPAGWEQALADLADATGSAVGELIGIGSNAAIPFNIVSGMDADFNRHFIEAGGGDPAVNPRVNAGMQAPVLKVLAESDFITPEDYRRNPHYQEFAVPWDIPYICLSTLERTGGMLIGLAVARNARQGHITEAQRRVFATLAPHVRAAVRMQMALEGEGAALLVGAMDAMSMPAFVLDGSGRVRALTPSAEGLLVVDRGLQLKAGRLQAINAGDNATLKAALETALNTCGAGASPQSQAVVIRTTDNALSMVLDVVTLPQRPFEFSFAPRVLVLARGERGSEGRRIAILRTAYALTAAEADIAVQVADGMTAERIAESRGVSLGTVRFQIKAILAKLGVKRQVELAAKIGRL